jgi:predicted site-specific integrase-resolvase
MLGRYRNFPEVIHGMARFSFLSSQQELQQVILEVIHGLNHKRFGMKDFTPFVVSECEVSFEFGVAEDVTFNYLDREELERVIKQIEIKPLRVLDVFSVIRYHINVKGKRRPLRFDYNMLRFAFSRKNMELLVAHERGNQRVSIEDFIGFLANKINEKLMKAARKPLTLKYLRAL